MVNRDPSDNHDEDSALPEGFSFDLSGEGTTDSGGSGMPAGDDPFAGLPDAIDLNAAQGADPFADVEAVPAAPIVNASPVQPQPTAGSPVAAQPIAAQPVAAKKAAVIATAAPVQAATATGESSSAKSRAPITSALLDELVATSGTAGEPVSVSAPPDATDSNPSNSRRRRLLLQEAPSWLISLVVHVAVLMLLAAFQWEHVQDVISILDAGSSTIPSESESLENFDIQGPDELAAPMADAQLPDQSSEVSSSVALPDVSAVASISVSTDAPVMTNFVEGIVPSSALSAGAATRLSSSLSSRSSARKGEMLEKYGGNAASEKSVAAALKWIAAHQARNGGWTFGHSSVCRGQCKDDGDIPQATNAATALALLPFLGAGQTHIEGSYKDTVKKGLAFLIANMKVNGAEQTGSWHEPGGNMYSHGLASIAICEAYAMTRDPDLLQPAQLAINYIVAAQHPQGGGWRYSPKQPGDTSVVGWQLMAMKSGSMGNLAVPIETFRKANNFLDSMSLNNGAYYGYDKPTSQAVNMKATTAVGLLCRMYMGWPKDHPGMKEGVAALSKFGPSVEDVYYSYYATQVLRQHGGPEWERWNTVMRDGLIKAQSTEGHSAGSWYSGAGHNVKGGRLYCTAMSTMILEVYYRHMPLYSEKSSDDEFEL
ncbi:MAG: hypothetical protein U0892_10330 [Pirellulales bacterium]